MSKRVLTIQQLANLCNFAWEVERAFGFHMRPETFKRYIEKVSPSDLARVLESLSELLRTAHEIGMAEFTLTASGEHPFLAKLGAFRTPTAAACGVDEHLINEWADPDKNP
jgi:hypothetical protein